MSVVPGSSAKKLPAPDKRRSRKLTYYRRMQPVATFRTGTASSQGESRCSAIQRNPRTKYSVELMGWYW
jgi:hypothetical protein